MSPIKTFSRNDTLIIRQPSQKNIIVLSKSRILYLAVCNLIYSIKLCHLIERIN